MRGRVGVLLQCRYGSTRLPGKALLDAAGQPLLQRVWERIQACREVDTLLVSTSDSSIEIHDFCRGIGIPFEIGPEQDLLTRHLAAVRKHGLDAMVRVTGDNPLTDAAGIDELVTTYRATGRRVVHNKHRGGLPFGTGAELIATDLLEELEGTLDGSEDQIALLSSLKDPRAGFDPYLVPSPPALVRPAYFLTVDYPKDLALMRVIYRQFDGRNKMPLADVVSWLDDHPDVAASNRHLHEGFEY